MLLSSCAIEHYVFSQYQPVKQARMEPKCMIGAYTFFLAKRAHGGKANFQSSPRRPKTSDYLLSSVESRPASPQQIRGFVDQRIRLTSTPSTTVLTTETIISYAESASTYY